MIILGAACLSIEIAAHSSSCSRIVGETSAFNALMRCPNEKRLHYITPYGVIWSMEQLTNVLSAISHPTRRAIIKRLANGPARFLDIAEPFDVALNAITKHLKLLERAGLIERARKGREVFISLRPEGLRLVADWVHEYERFWNEKLDEFAGYFKQKQRSKK
jgi:DNA-binding transcriptional ArsR family regulator